MPAPLAFSDEQIDAILRAAGPLLPSDRTAFLEEVAAKLERLESRYHHGQHDAASETPTTTMMTRAKTKSTRTKDEEHEDQHDEPARVIREPDDE
jgi:hypothetical protein